MDIVITHNLLCARGGAEKVILEIAKKFEPVAIYVLRYDKEGTYPEFSEFNVVEMGAPRGSLLVGPVGASKFYGMKIREDYDVVNAHWPPSHWVRNRNPGCVWYCHSPSRAVYDLYDYRMGGFSLPVKLGHYFYSKAYRAVDRRVCSGLEHIFANSRNVQGRISKYLGQESEVLYPGVDYDEYECRDYDKYFFLPGRIDPTKRIEYVISAFNEFRKTHGDFRLVIAGSLDEKFRWYYEKIKSIFDGEILLNVDSYKMLELYSNCYCVLFSGMDEDFGITPLEGMACSKPVISVNEGGPRETVVDGKTGFLVGDAASMARRMGELADDFGLAERMGRAGRLRVRAMFSWDVFLRRFGAVCRDVADRTCG